MWISKKKLNQMIEEAAAKEREREMLYRFMDEVHVKLGVIEDKIRELDAEVYSLHKTGKKQLNG